MTASAASNPITTDAIMMQIFARRLEFKILNERFFTNSFFSTAIEDLQFFLCAATLLRHLKTNFENI